MTAKKKRDLSIEIYSSMEEENLAAAEELERMLNGKESQKED